MKLTVPTLAISLTAVAAATVPDASASGKSYLPSAYVHNMGMKALNKARADVLRRVKSDQRKLLRTSSNRKLVDGSESDILGDDTDLDFESLMGDTMASMGSLICAALEWGQDLAAEFEVDLESGVDIDNLPPDFDIDNLPPGVDIDSLPPGVDVDSLPPGVDIDNLPPDVDIDTDTDGLDDVNVVCDEFGCDDPEAEVPNLVMRCNMDGEVCEVHDGEEFCATGASIDYQMSLNFTGTSYITAGQCNDFSKPQNLADAGRFCFTILAEVDYSNLFSSMWDFDMELTETQDVGDAGLGDFFQITSCAGTYDDGEAECECGICNDGMGFELKCGDLITEECTNFDTTEVGAVAGGGAEEPSVAVLRLVDPLNADGVTVVSDVDAEGSTDSGAPGESGNDVESGAGDGDGSSPDDETTVDGENTDSDETDAVAETESTPETAADEGNETGTDVTDAENTEETGSTDEDVVAKADTTDDPSPAASRSGLVVAGLALVFASSMSLV